MKTKVATIPDIKVEYKLSEDAKPIYFMQRPVRFAILILSEYGSHITALQEIIWIFIDLDQQHKKKLFTSNSMETENQVNLPQNELTQYKQLLGYWHIHTWNKWMALYRTAFVD